MSKEEVMKLAREAGPLISTPFDVWCERFAKLIVRECCLLCLHNVDIDRIEEHFGVEE